MKKKTDAEYEKEYALLKQRLGLDREISPDEYGRMERIMLGVVEREEAPMWKRR